MELWARVEIGASGAPTLDVDNNSKGIASITRDAQGVYTVVLQDSYFKLLDVMGCFDAGSAGPAAPTVSIANADVGLQDGGEITILTQNGGSNTDPADGEVMYIRLTLSNTTAI